MSKVIITSSKEETQWFGKDLVSKLKDRNIIALYGDLGSGKTTFVQGLAKGLGIKKRIISPTFVLVRQYKIKNQKSKIKTTAQNSKFFYHVDLYRVNNKKEIDGLGIKEIIDNKNNFVAIEWAEKISNLLPKNRINVYCKYLDYEKRKISIS